MALNFLTGLDVQGNINLTKKELQNAVIQNLATDPAVGVSVVGQIIFNTTDDTLKQFVSDADGAGNPGWIEVGTTSGVETVTTTDGTYINLTPNTATSGNVTVTADLSAVDGTAVSGTRFLSKDNTWDVPAFPTVNNGTLTMSTSTGLDGGATFTANQSGNSTFAVTLDLTEITLGAGLDATATGLSLDLSEFVDMTAAMLTTDEFIVLDGGAERRKAAGEIGLSIFLNDAGFTSNTGDITSVTAGTGLSGGGSSGAVTITNSAPNVDTDLSSQHFVGAVRIHSSDGTSCDIEPATGALAGIVTAGGTQFFGGTKSFGNEVIIGQKISHSGDADTYMEFHALDQWRVVTGNSEGLEVTNNQVLVNRPDFLIQNSGDRMMDVDSVNGTFFLGDVDGLDAENFITTENGRIDLVVGGSETLSVNPNNTSVGIGNTSPGYKLDVSGTGRFTSTVTATNFILSSDERLKTKVKTLTPNKIDVAWKSFEMKEEKGLYRTGVIAQELEKTHPEFVADDAEGYKTVKYIDLLIAKIAELEARLEKAGI